MKTPISYYGGKQELAKKIISLIPSHKTYCEPFIGGAAIFFAKPVSKAEIINDINSEVINFYEVLKHDFSALQAEIEISLHSRKLYQHAHVIYENPDMFDRIKRAWAFWVLANMSFNNSLTAGFKHDKIGKTSRSIAHKQQQFTEDLAIRLQNVQIECCDALKIIRQNDNGETFFYLDPPYVGACQGHYDGYSQADFNELIDLLAKIGGKFLLSSFRNTYLSDASKRYGWSQIELKMNTHPSFIPDQHKSKIEVLTANYPISL